MKGMLAWWWCFIVFVFVWGVFGGKEAVLWRGFVCVCSVVGCSWLLDILLLLSSSLLLLL